MRIRYYCHFAKLTGYGRAAHDYLQALDDHTDLEIDIVGLGEPGTSLEPRYNQLARLAENELASPDLAIYHSTPRALAALVEAGLLDQSAGGQVALTTWETDRMPDQYRGPLGAYDAMIVPSEFCWRAMDLNGALPVHVVPHCFDPEFWAWNRHMLHPEDPAFHFYSIGAWGERKNQIGLLKAYLHEFSKDDRVALYLLSAGADFTSVRSLLARTGLAPDQLPGLHVPNEQLTEDQLLALHLGGDCFVSATRGEGFGLGHFEAAIVGKDIVTPGCGGFVDFLDDYDFAHYVDYRQTPCYGVEVRGDITKDEHGNFVQTSRVSLPPGVDCKQTWADPDLVELGKKMRAVCEDRTPRSVDKQREARARLERVYGYEPVATLLANTLKEIADGRTTEALPDD
ncbi:MAG: glycosyltransferase [Deltaproteobacteria bacterium]|nr:glycosyltransferase [Deltaproteobacteria bacterium]